jgi:hypothetical protein
MRILGILAIFLLSVCAIAEGAFLFRLSGRVHDLQQEAAVAHEAALRPAPEVPAAPSARVPVPARPAAPTRAPAGAPPAFTPPPASTAATATLRDALSTPEGRDQLRAAMDVIAEQRRQERLVKFVERREERDQRWKERITKAIPLSGDEPQKLGALFTSLQTGRRQLLEDMKAGAKTAEETDSAMDDLQESTQKAVRSLLGDDRWRKLREDRGGRGQGGQAGQAGQAGDGQPQNGGERRGRRGPPPSTPPPPGGVVTRGS